MTVRTETLEVGPLEVNCYIIGCDEHKLCAVIDPGDSSKLILSAVKNNGWEVTHIINTHAHVDHIGANGKLKEATGARIFLHKDDAELITLPQMKDMAAYLGLGASPAPDEFIEDGDTIEICPCLIFKVLHTPGHTRGGVCLRFGDCVVSGDSLFRVSIGRTDMHGGDMDTLLNSIRTKLFTLDDDVVVYPGHGKPTDIGFEKKNNPFLTNPSY